MSELREFDVVSRSLCGVADLSQMHESDFPGSYVVIILSRGLLTNEKKRADWWLKKKHKKIFRAVVEWLSRSELLRWIDEVRILQ